MPKNKASSLPPTPPHHEITYYICTEFRISDFRTWRSSRGYFSPSQIQTIKLLTRFSSLPPWKECQNHSYMYSCVTQNSIFKLRQNISLVIYRRKPLTSERMEQQDSFMLLQLLLEPILNTEVAGNTCMYTYTYKDMFSVT